MTPTEATTVVVNEGKSMEKCNKAHAEKTLRAVDSKLESLNTEIGKIICFRNTQLYIAINADSVTRLGKI